MIEGFKITNEIEPESDIHLPISKVYREQKTIIELHPGIATVKIQTIENTTGKEKNEGKLLIKKYLKM